MTTSTPSPPTDNATPAKERVPIALVLALSIGPVSFISYLVFFHLRGYHLVPAPYPIEFVGLCTLLFLLISGVTAVSYLCFHAFQYGVTARLRKFTTLPLAATFVMAATVLLGILPIRGHPPFMRILNNATHISQMMQIYAIDHEGRYPPHLSAFLLENPFLARDFVDHRSVTTPPAIPDPPPPSADWPKYVSEVDNHTIFIYTAADLVDPSLTAANQPALDRAIIVAYTKKLPLVPRHRIVAFISGPADIIPDADLPAIFAASNAAREKLGLLPFTLDGLPPAPPH